MNDKNALLEYVHTYNLKSYFNYIKAGKKNVYTSINDLIGYIL